MEVVGWVAGVVIGFAITWQAAWIGREAWRRHEVKNIQDAAELGWTRLIRPDGE